MACIWIPAKKSIIFGISRTPEMSKAMGALCLANPQDVLFKAIFVERRLSRHHLKEVSISAIILRVMEENISVKDGGLIALGLSRILIRKLRYLLDECNEVVHKICRKDMDRERSFKQPSSRGITLGLDLESLYVDDQMIDPEEFTILPEEEDPGDGQDPGDVSFGGLDDISYIEEARLGGEDSTRISTTTEVTQISLGERKEKKRRIAEDTELEFDSQVFRVNLRNTRDIIHKESALDIRNELASRLSIAPEILSRIGCREMHPRESIESVRDATIVESYGDISFGEHAAESQASEEIVMESYLDIEKLPRTFVFNEISGGHNRYEKGRLFLSLLNLLGSGVVQGRQKNPYSDIECTVVQ
uniref:Rad21/Rec8-like protein N-terminal domain-containing protein n=1 Tax=Encephalitozoon cuniculi TaxID=6035 RepID=M1K867_ENCCN|nr:hypothetical protein ECU04_1370 [Encephalitozoon cuniculi]